MIARRGDGPGDALSAALPLRGSPPPEPRGVIRFFHGPMDCGKSTLALQVDHNQTRQGRRGLVLVRHDRSGRAQISSRMGLSRPAREIGADQDLHEIVREARRGGRGVDYLVLDEAQFLSPAQVDQLAGLADDHAVDCFCFGITTDFRGRLFDGSRRLIELADDVRRVQAEVLCWCSAPGRFNARVVAGEMVRDGDTVVVADTRGDAGAADVTGSARNPGGVGDGPAEVRYQVLCRHHHRLGDLGPDRSDQDELPLDEVFRDGPQEP